MSTALELENLALGEVTLEEGSKTVRAVLAHLDASSAADLYEALRSWTWKTLEARRRDDELSGWMDMFSRASSHIETISRDLAIKIEAFIELLQASVMTAAVAADRDPLARKHVRSAMACIYHAQGRIRRRELMDHLGLKAPNLSRVMTPLQDDGYVMREVDGREIFYRLTIKGRHAAAAIVARESLVVQVVSRRTEELTKIVNIVPLAGKREVLHLAKSGKGMRDWGYQVFAGNILDRSDAPDDLFDFNMQVAPLEAVISSSGIAR